MAAESAGIVLYKRKGRGLLVLLVHPGGPFWRNKDDGAWTIPKGERGVGEDAETTARREFAEELGTVLTGTLVPLGRICQRGGKNVDGFALEGDLDVERISGNSFEIEWPPKSRKRKSIGLSAAAEALSRVRRCNARAARPTGGCL